MLLRQILQLHFLWDFDCAIRDYACTTLASINACASCSMALSSSLIFVESSMMPDFDISLLSSQSKNCVTSLLTGKSISAAVALPLLWFLSHFEEPMVRCKWSSMEVALYLKTHRVERVSNLNVLE